MDIGFPDTYVCPNHCKRTEATLRDQIARIIADDVCEHGEKCDATEWHGDTADKIIALVREATT